MEQGVTITLFIITTATTTTGITGTTTAKYCSHRPCVASTVLFTIPCLVQPAKESCKSSVHLSAYLVGGWMQQLF